MGPCPTPRKPFEKGLLRPSGTLPNSRPSRQTRGPKTFRLLSLGSFSTEIPAIKQLQGVGIFPGGGGAGEHREVHREQQQAPRGKGRQQQRGALALQSPGEGKPPGKGAFLVQQGMQTLPEKQRMVFNLKYYQEMKYEEMSEIFGTSVVALKASYHHAVKKIEKFLEEID